MPSVDEPLHSIAMEPIKRLGGMLQASTPWRKAQAKLEGEPEFEDLSKTDRLEVYQDYMKYVCLTLHVTAVHCRHCCV